LELSARAAVAFAGVSPGAPDGQAVVLDVAQLEALLTKTLAKQAQRLDDLWDRRESVAAAHAR